MANYTYEEYRQRVSVIQVAVELGYRYDRIKGGRSTPSFVLQDSRGNLIDRIYIKNPHNNAEQGYWRRNPINRKSSGDLIDFIKENLDQFIESTTARNEVDAINKVLARFANVPIDSNIAMKQTITALKERTARPFTIERYKREPGNVDKAMGLLLPRGITRDTAELFKDNFEMIHDTESKTDFYNLAFPFRKPGEDKILGYEIRGFRGFKSKAEGTDSTHACWMAYVGKDSPDRREITELHFAESALDAMAFVQLNSEQLNLDECLFISFGGAFSADQMRNVLQEYGFARPILHFDNDPTGVLYDCQTAAIMTGKEMKHTRKGDEVLFTVGERSFSIPFEKLSYNQFREGSGLRPDLRLWKAPGGFKDWNDLTINQLNNENKNSAKAEVNEKIEYKKRGFKM